VLSYVAARGFSSLAAPVLCVAFGGGGNGSGNFFHGGGVGNGDYVGGLGALPAMLAMTKARKMEKTFHYTLETLATNMTMTTTTTTTTTMTTMTKKSKTYRLEVNPRNRKIKIASFASPFWPQIYQLDLGSQLSQNYSRV